MRTIVLATAAAMAIGCAAQAQDTSTRINSNPQWVRKPTPDEMTKAYPAQAGGYDGHATIECTVVVAGSLSNCSVREETPARLGFGSAALSLAPMFLMKPAAKDGKPVVGQVSIPIAFEGPKTATDANGVNARWLRKPTFDEVSAVFPAQAHGSAGRVIIVCTVEPDGTMADCFVRQETPAGMGFGTAALTLAPTFLIKPATKDGKPVASQVGIPINFVSRERDKGEMDGFGTVTVKVATTLPWKTAPTTEDVMAAFPKGAVGKATRGDVVEQCMVTTAGKLKSCAPLNVSPVGMGFEGAARSLISKFTVDEGLPATAKDQLGVNIRLQILARDNPAWKDRRLTKVTWNQTIDYAAAQAVYPGAAVKAGVGQGVGTVDCLIAPGGGLTDCSVVSETPPGLGFGASSKAIASVFVANPWTESGLPAEGARVGIPIRMVYDGKPAATPPAKP